jgi:hypothetical protein
MTQQESKQIRVSAKTWETLRELSFRTRIDMGELVNAIFESVQKQIDLLKPSGTLAFLSDLYVKDTMPKTFVSLIRVSDAGSFGFDSIPSELKAQVLEKFGYKLENGAFIDTREKPKEDVKQ